MTVLSGAAVADISDGGRCCHEWERAHTGWLQVSQCQESRGDGGGEKNISLEDEGRVGKGKSGEVCVF